MCTSYVLFPVPTSFHTVVSLSPTRLVTVFLSLFDTVRSPFHHSHNFDTVFLLNPLCPISVPLRSPTAHLLFLLFLLPHCLHSVLAMFLYISLRSIHCFHRVYLLRAHWSLIAPSLFSQYPFFFTQYLFTVTLLS